MTMKKHAISINSVSKLLKLEGTISSETVPPLHFYP